MNLTRFINAKRWVKVASILALVSAAPLACAGTQTGKVTMLIVRASDGLIYATLENSASGRPACATASYWMIKAENSNTGKQQYAMLLAAKLAGKTIQIWGANTCTRWADGEDIDALVSVD